MTDHMDTEALQALVALGPLTVSHQNGDPEESFRGIVGREVITRRGKGVHFYVAQYVLPENAPLFAQTPALAAEVLELREKLAEIAPAIAVMHSEAKAAFDELDATRKRLSAMHRRAQRSEGIIERTAQASTKAVKAQLRWFGPGEKPHHYSPDLMAGGSDCRICGHDYDAHHATAHGDLA